MNKEILLYALLIIFVSIFAVMLLDFSFYLVSWTFLFIVSRFFNPKKEYEKPSKFSHFILIWGYKLICRMGRVKIHYSGKELVPNEQFLLVSNHASKFDNMIHSIVLKEVNLSFVSKPENFKIPLGGRFINRNCYINLKRGDGKSAIQMIMRTTKLLKDGICSIGIFPEGTRSKDGELLPYKPGVLKIAERAECPVVVGVTKNTLSIHKNWPFHRTDVYFDILKVYQASELKEKDTLQLMSEIEALTKENLIKEI